MLRGYEGVIWELDKDIEEGKWLDIGKNNILILLYILFYIYI